MPDHIDGRYLFDEFNETFFDNTIKIKKQKTSLSSIVMIEAVKEARERNVLNAVRPFESFYEEGVIWKNGLKEKYNAVIWCTGFKANLKHFKSLNIIEEANKIKTKGTQSIKEPNLWLVGYGNWTGFASATIYGVGKTARQTAKEITELLLKKNEINLKIKSSSNLTK